MAVSIGTFEKKKKKKKEEIKMNKRGGGGWELQSKTGHYCFV